MRAALPLVVSVLWLVTGVSASVCATSAGGNFTLCRQLLVEALFGTPTLPSRAPDAGPSAAPNALSNNHTMYQWIIRDDHPHAPNLTATVYLSLNSSGHTTPNYPMGPPTKGGQYRWPWWPQRRGGSVVLYHNGHETTSNASNFDGVVWYFNSLGFDVAEFDMPLYGFNSVPGVPSNHWWFLQFEQMGVRTLRYFVEPVVLFVDYAVNVLGYDRVIMAGLSGGGWTTTLAAAIDPRIQLSFPVAGGLPFSMYNSFYDSRDYEQEPQRPIYKVADYLDQYVMGGMDAGRAQMQILHMMDSCCWTACTRQPDILAYNKYVQSLGANFRTVDSGQHP